MENALLLGKNKEEEEEEGGEGMLGGSERKGKVGCMDSRQEEDHRED